MKDTKHDRGPRQWRKFRRGGGGCDHGAYTIEGEAGGLYISALG